MEAAYRTTEIRDIERGMIRLFKELLPALEKSEIGILIGDDTSGRIPALILHRAINSYNARRGLPAVPLIFLQGTSAADQIPELERVFADRLPRISAMDSEKRALIVTEGISSGGAVARLGSLLTRERVTFDVAVLDGRGFRRDHPRSDGAREEEKVASWSKDLEAVLASNLPEAERLTDLYATICRHWDTAQVHNEWLFARLAEGFFPQSEIDELALCTDISRLKKTTREDTFRLPEIIALGLHVAMLGRARAERLLSFMRSFSSGLPQSRDVYRTLSDMFEMELLEPDELDADFAALEVLMPAPDTNGTHVPLDSAGWPVRTRLFRGEQGARPIRDREDMTGLRGEKFSRHPLVRNTGAVRDMVRTVRADVRICASRVIDSLRFSGDMIPVLIPPVFTLLEKLGPSIRGDEYGVIVGENPTGRIPTLMIGRAINEYRTTRGLPALPIVFLSSSDRPHAAEQIAEFARLAPSLKDVEKGKRALVVTDFVGDSAYIGSILNRLASRGMSADVACLNGANDAELASFRSQGNWRSSTRGYSAGSARGILYNRPDLSGLASGSDGGAGVEVIRDSGVRKSVCWTRRDIATAARELAASLA